MKKNIIKCAFLCFMVVVLIQTVCFADVIPWGTYDEETGNLYLTRKPITNPPSQTEETNISTQKIVLLGLYVVFIFFTSYILLELISNKIKKEHSAMEKNNEINKTENKQE